jgi:hypothetical protein
MLRKGEVIDSSEHGNIPLYSINGGELLEYSFLKNNLAP